MRCLSIVRLLAVVLLIFILPSTVIAEGPGLGELLPPDDSDLKQIIDNAAAIEGYSADCGGDLECPEMDCVTARALRGTLLNLRNNLIAMKYWSELANDAHMNHFRALAEQGILTSEQLAKVQMILAYQEYVMGIANGLLDIADIVGFVKGAIKDPSQLNPANFEKLVNLLWKVDKLIKNTESLATNVAGGVTGEQFDAPYASFTPDAFGVEGKDWNRVKSVAGELMGALTATKENAEYLGDCGLSTRAKYWKAFNGVKDKDYKSIILKDKEGGRANVLSLMGSLVSAWGASNMQERAEHAQQMQLDLMVSDLAQGKAFQQLMRVRTRRYMTGDALAAVKQAMSAFDACASQHCPLESIVAERIPDFLEVSPDEKITIESWGRALRYFNSVIPGYTERMLELPDIWDNCPCVPIDDDSSAWCFTRDGGPTLTDGGDDGDDPRDTPPPDDGDDPRDTPPPDDGDDPRDVGGPCEEELELLRTYMRKHGADLRESAETDPEDAEDLKKITDRLRELENMCDDDDPQDVGEPEPLTPTGPTITSRRDDDDGDEPRDVGEPIEITVTIYIKAGADVLEGESTSQATAGQQIMLFADSTLYAELPGPADPAQTSGTGGTEAPSGGAEDKPQTGHDQDPLQAVTGPNGEATIEVPASAIGILEGAAIAGVTYEIGINTTPQASRNAQLAGTNPEAAIIALPEVLQNRVTDVTVINGQMYVTFTYPASMDESVNLVLVHTPVVILVEINYCRTIQGSPNDPLYRGAGAWGQSYDNQWAIKRVGFTDDGMSAWTMLGEHPMPVVVAVIDTGLDWHHLDFSRANLWRNPGETPDNGKDDDGNGYVDDIIGWDFIAGHNRPWDHDGHGTFIAGVIAATQNNNVGIAGINPHAQIMVLKALNSFGHTRASYLAKAIVYAVDNGAQIINMSVGGKKISVMEKEAIKYAKSKGVLVVVAAGNEGINASEFGVAGLESVLTVAATDLEDKRPVFSNWGAQIDIAAPGVEVLSLRARRTDTMRDIPGVEYEAGAAYVGDDKRYYRAGGTSFSAPIVTGVASLLLSVNPNFTAEQVAQILKQTATDVDVPGVDQYTGHGIVNAVEALRADPNRFITAHISEVQIVQGSAGPVVRVMGAADADEFRKASVDIGAGENPTQWKTIISVDQAVKSGALGDIPANELRSSRVWIIRLTTEHKDGSTQEFRFRLSLG